MIMDPDTSTITYSPHVGCLLAPTCFQYITPPTFSLKKTLSTNVFVSFRFLTGLSDNNASCHTNTHTHTCSALCSMFSLIILICQVGFSVYTFHFTHNHFRLVLLRGVMCCDNAHCFFLVFHILKLNIIIYYALIIS